MPAFGNSLPTTLPAIALPERCGQQVLHVIDHYKHLGGQVAINASLFHDAKHKASAAMSAYCPLAIRIFGSRILSVWCKLHYLSSLILSRLLQNVHTWVVSPQSLQILNAVYMRVLRRIADKLRYDSSCECSDAEVRRILSQPSIDCLVQRKRLIYMARLAYVQPKALWAILQASPRKQQMPWTC